MFNNPRPLTGYGETAGWAISLQPTPKPGLKRPPILKTASSASSLLTGMEQTVAPGLKQPPILTTSTSNTSLRSDQHVQSFQDFIKRTPPLDDGEPLPIAPLRYRRNSYDSIQALSSCNASPTASRKTSSVYSRTASQWFSDSPVWGAVEFADLPIPAIPHELLLWPIAYSASTRHLVEKPPTPPLLEPRVYQPLIVTPSPTASRATSPSPSPSPSSSLRLRPESRLSVLLPAPLPSPEIKKEHLRTVSLEKAKATSSAPGASHMLPEEMRAQDSGRAKMLRPHTKALSRSRSFEPIVKTAPVVRDTLAILSSEPETPASGDSLTLMLVDSQGRGRVVGSPRAIVAPLPTLSLPEEPPVPSLESGGSFAVGTNAPKSMVPLAKLDQMRHASRDKVTQALGIDNLNTLCGRPMARSPRSMSYEHYRLGATINPSLASSVKEEEEEEDDAHFVARKYHALLSEQCCQGSVSSNVSSVRSDAEIGEHMRMAPQPLFHGKPRALRSSLQQDRSNLPTDSLSPHRREQSDSSFSVHSRSPDHGSKVFLPPLSIRPQTRRRSTSDTIPTSPPNEYFPANLVAIVSPYPHAHVLPRHRRNSNDNRVSAYFPVTTKGSNTLLSRRSDEKKHSLPLYASPTSPTRPERTKRSANLPPQSRPPQTFHSPSPSPTYHKQPHETEHTAKQALLSRIAKGAAKYADLLTRPAGYESRPRANTASSTDTPTHPSTSPRTKPLTLTIQASSAFTTASAESQHLHPSPPHHAATHSHSHSNIHGTGQRLSLAWSSTAKTVFDAATSPRSEKSTRSGGGGGGFEHHLTPPRPLDERNACFFETEDADGDGGEGGRRTGSILTRMMDFGRKEARAERRREEIKRSIRVVGWRGTGAGG